MRVRITKQLQNTVRQLLETDKQKRDSDYLLMAKIWQDECRALGANFFEAFSNEQLTPPDSIGRARRKIQEQHQHLRGSVWYERHEHEEVVKNDLGYQTKLL